MTTCRVGRCPHKVVWKAPALIIAPPYRAAAHETIWLCACHASVTPILTSVGESYR